MNKIRQFRRAIGLSQQELASVIGVTTGAIGFYERGLREPNLATIKKLAEALNCKPMDLYPVLEG
ncbi:helix-turn-helix transcriptional regulator [Mannheimia indoligenes]|uniref:helix-turn-helix domain-containing protein n=1 Tax=Mannheimia indoligenes TaxID=3103145 RepID=UPI002FE65F2E